MRLAKEPRRSVRAAAEAIKLVLNGRAHNTFREIIGGPQPAGRISGSCRNGLETSCMHSTQTAHMFFMMLALRRRSKRDLGVSSTIDVDGKLCMLRRYTAAASLFGAGVGTTESIISIVAADDSSAHVVRLLQAGWGSGWYTTCRWTTC